jgi:hypothetical protein
MIIVFVLSASSWYINSQNLLFVVLTLTQGGSSISSVNNVELAISKGGYSNNETTVAPSELDVNNTIEINGSTTTNTLPGIVWLLSFPNSGTTYTLKVIQDMTNTTTATNYGGSEQTGYIPSIPIFANTDGPFARYPQHDIPKKYILTKTHCHGKNNPETVNDFITLCRTGDKKFSNRTVISTSYNIHHINGSRQQQLDEKGAATEAGTDTDNIRSGPGQGQGIKIHRIVHLIRNPFDNIVARLHYQRKRWKHELSKQDVNDPKTVKRINSNKNNNYDINVPGYEHHHHQINNDTYMSTWMIQSSYLFEDVDTKLTTQEKLDVFTDDKNGLYRWCSWIDRNSVRTTYMRKIFQNIGPPSTNDTDYTSLSSSSSSSSSFLWMELWQKYLKKHNGTIPPCLTEFYRYLSWHRFVIDMLNQKQQPGFKTTPLYRLYYENYTTSSTVSATITKNIKVTRDDGSSPRKAPITNRTIQLSRTVADILQFLQFNIDTDIVSEPPPFVEGKHYTTEYYNDADRYLLGSMAKSYLQQGQQNNQLSDESGWQLLQHYFQ